jgi:hypothetical protein
VCRARSPRSPSLQNCAYRLEPTAFTRAAEEGRIGRLCAERAACGLLRYSQRGPRARDVTTEYSRGTPSYGYSARVPSWLLWVRRSTAERPSPLRVCSKLSNNALNGCVPSSPRSSILNPCACPLLATAVVRAADVARIGRLCSERTACRASMSGASSGGGAAAGPVAVISEGLSGTRCD